MGLAHVSLGRYMSERRGSSFRTRDTDDDSWKLSEHVFKKTGAKSTRAIHYELEIECTKDVIEDFNSKGDLGVILQFKGFNFFGNQFTKHERDCEPNLCVYSIPINYKEKDAELILSTQGNVLESKVQLRMGDSKSLFSDKTVIQETIETYNPLSMDVKQTNGVTIISYKRK